MDRKLTIVDIAVPSDVNIKDKEAEKVSKYKDLKLELQKMWNVKAKVVDKIISAREKMRDIANKRHAKQTEVSEFMHQMDKLFDLLKCTCKCPIFHFIPCTNYFVNDAFFNN